MSYSVKECLHENVRNTQVLLCFMLLLYAQNDSLNVLLDNTGDVVLRSFVLIFTITDRLSASQ